VRSKAGYAKRVREKFGPEVREPIVVPDGHRRCPDRAEVKPVEAVAKAEGVLLALP
jgi:hypothetical protein